MKSKYIESSANKYIKELTKLRDRKYRDQQNKFTIEGLREISRAFESKYEIHALYYCDEYLVSQNSKNLVKNIALANIPLTRLHPNVFKRCSVRENPDGLIAVSSSISFKLTELNLNKKATIVVLEGIEKPGNLGAIIRSSDGSGADAIILNNCMIDIYNPNVIRSSQGLVFKLPIIKSESKSIKEWLVTEKFRTIATTPRAKIKYNEIEYYNRNALILGSESKGLTDNWIKNVDLNISIPMSGLGDSLNVSVAAGICLYEIAQHLSK